jgi:alpha-amylase
MSAARRPTAHRRLSSLGAALWLAPCLALCATCASDVAEVTDEFVVTNHAADWRGEFIYQIIVDRFANGDLNNDVRVVPGALGRYQGGDWQGIIDNVDYLVELGVTAVWISPIVRNVETDAGYDSYHGYWTQDFLDINPHFGDIATLREMVRVLHDNGILVILDIVANHVGQLFYYDINGNGQPDEFVGGSGVRSPLERTSEYDPDFDIRGVQAVTGLGESGDARITFFDMPEINRVAPEPAVFANPEWYSRRGRVTAWGREAETCRRDLGIDPDADWETCFAYVREQEITGDFPGGLKDLRTDLPEVREALIDVMTYWIDYIDIDGFRIDTVKHVEHDFWEQFGTAVREYAHSVGKENFFMFGEAFDGNDWLIGSYTAPGMLDSVFYFSQKFRVYDALFMHGRATADAAALWADRQVNFNTEPQPLGIVDADGNGVPPTQLLVNFIDNHDVSRFLYDQPDIDRLHAALGLLFTQDGIPCVYYGTEQGFSGGDDPANREPLWDSGYDRQHPTYQWISSLARMRRSYPELMFGTQHVTWSTNHTADEQDAGILAFERRYRGARALVIHNTSFENTSRTSTSEEGGQHMAVSFAPGTELADVMPGGGFEVFTVSGTGCDLEGTCRQPVADDADDARCGCLDVGVPPSGGRVLVETGRVLRDDR